MAVSILGALLTGCASNPSAPNESAASAPPAEAQGAFVGGGAGWQAVLPGPDIELAMREEAPAEWRAEFARRDADLSVREPGVLLATSQWPEERRPSVDHTRVISLPSSSGSYLFFRPWRDADRHHRRWR